MAREQLMNERASVLHRKAKVLGQLGEVRCLSDANKALDDVGERTVEQREVRHDRSFFLSA
jgi:hypothetical protein